MHDNDPRSAIRVLVLEGWLRDQAAGLTVEIGAYQAAYPGFEADVAGWLREFAAQAAEAEADGAARMLGSYRLGDEVGRGGQAVVYRAHDCRLGRTVAVKVLQHVAGDLTQSLPRFRREANVVARLDHPGIAGVLDVGVDGGMPFLVMQFVEGQTLARWLAAERDRVGADPNYSEADRIRRAVRLVAAVARTLQVAHDHGIVHRDVKPANIMVTPDGLPVVMDFGLAHDESSASLGLTRTGDLLGSPGYMAPEQLESDVGPIDGRTDVWALGVTLYECVALERPFEAPSREQLYHRILSAAFVPLRRRCRTVGRDLETVVGMALQKDRWLRYGSASALACDLEALLAGRPVAARPVGLLVRGLRWARREPTLAALLCVLLFGVPIAAALVSHYAAAAQVQAARQAQSVATELEAALGRHADLLHPELLVELDRRLQELDTAHEFERLHSRPVAVTLSSVPGAATLRVLDARSGRIVATGETPWTGALDEGSYVAVLDAEEHAKARLPFVVRRLAARSQPADEVFDHEVELLGHSRLGTEDVLIPGGWTLIGRELRWQRIETFAMRRREVTYGEWLQFLASDWLANLCSRSANRVDELVPQVAGLGDPPHAERRGGEWILTGPRQPSDAVHGVTRDAVDLFVSWMNFERRPVGAGYWYDLPTEAEWERAARGADGRRYPWGNQFENHHRAMLYDADIRQRGERCRDDVSPFGVLDLAGSVSELTASHWRDALVLESAKGGSVYSNAAEDFGAAERLRLQNTAMAGVGFRLIKRFVPDGGLNVQPVALPFEDQFAPPDPRWHFTVGGLLDGATSKHGESWRPGDGCVTLQAGEGTGSKHVAALLPVLFPRSRFRVVTTVMVERQDRYRDQQRGFTLGFGLGSLAFPVYPFSVHFFPDGHMLAQGDPSLAGQRRAEVGWREGVPMSIEVEFFDGRIELRAWEAATDRPANSQLTVDALFDGQLRHLAWSAVNYVGMVVRLEALRIEAVR